MDATIRREIGPMGHTLWYLPGTDLAILWSGPGSRLLIGTPHKAGGSVTTIDHPTARDTYDTRAAADRAVRAFVSAE